MATSKKYYTLWNNDSKEFSEFLREFDEPKRRIIKKGYNISDLYLLIEKTSNKDNTEKITNLYSCSNLSDVYRISNGKTIYDYTGIVKPIIHENLKVYLFDEYVNSKK